MPLRHPAPLHRTLFAAGLAASLLAGSGVPGARATALAWKSAVTGNAGTSTNWNPAQIPGSADDLTWNVGGTYTVTFGSTVTASHSHHYRTGTVTIVTTSPHTTGALQVGQLSGDVGTMTLTTGTLTATSDVQIGTASGATGTLNVDDLDAVLSLSGTSNLFVGGSGVGTLNVTGGGHVNAGVGGTAIGAAGTVLVSGATGSPVVRSSILGSQDLTVNGAGVTISNGGLYAAKGVFISQTVNHASIAVNGSASGFNATLTGSSLDLAHNATAGAAAGNGSLTIQNGGTVTISGATTIGDADGGSGNLTVGPGGFFTTGSLSTVDGHASLTYGGTITVNGGTFKPPGSILDLDAATPSTVVLQNGANASFDGGSFNGYALIVGDAHTSTFKVQTGSTLGLVNGVVTLGLQPGASGTVEVSGASTLGSGEIGQVVVGQGGLGTLNVLTGGHVSAATVFAGYAGGSTGSIQVTGAGSRIDGVSLDIGGVGTTPGGSGHVIVGNGGVISMVGDAFPLRILTATSSLEVDAGGLVTAPVQVDHRGQLIMGGGELDPGLLDFAAGASLTGHGTVSGRILADNADNVISASGGPLTLGFDSPAGFSNVGSLQVGSQTVTLVDAAAADLGNVTLAGGTLVLPAAGGSLASGMKISGGGTVSGPIANAGAIQAVGASPLAFSGIVSGIGQGITGSSLSFLSGGGFTGSGTISVAALTAAAGSRITTTGNLTLAATTGVSPLSLAGRIDAGSNQLTLQESVSACGLGSLTTLGGGTLRLIGGTNQLIQVSANDTLQGTGTVSNAVNNGGVILAGSPTGTLSLTSSYTQGGGAKLRVAIGDAPTNTFSKVAVSGAAALGGTLDVRRLDNQYPSPGETFTIMTYGSHTGTFSTVTFEGQPSAGHFTLSYGANALTLTVTDVTTDVATAPDLPRELAFRGRSGGLGQAGFDLDLPEAARVDVRVYDVSGREVAILRSGLEPVGRHRYMLGRDGFPPASGVYFARARVATGSGTIVRTARSVTLR